MAFRNRKLFPSSNETAYCSDICDPACPYYYYECPDLYFSQPPPPPLHPSVGSGSQSSSVSPSLITACSLLGGFFILLGYYVIIRKRCFVRRRRNNQTQALPGPGNGEFLEENRVDHHIWFIATVGLPQSIINTIAVCKYQKGEGLIEGSECSVCLNDFQEGELLRLLPKCSHAFHVRCIDTWLRSHTNCPLCRANIVSPPTVSEQSAASRPQMEPMEMPWEEVDLNREAQMEDSRESGGVEENLDRDLGIVNQEQTEESQQEVMEEVLLKDCCTLDDLEEIKPDRIKSERHLISDSSSSSLTLETQVYVDVLKSPESTDGLKVEAGDNLILKTEAAADLSSTGQCAVAIARSHSCGSGFFLSRHSRNSSSILPY